MTRLLLCCGFLATALLPPGVAGAADLSVSPSVAQGGVTTVKTGNLLTFEALPASDPADSWDLDGDGVADATGSPVQWAYAKPGPVSVTLTAPGGAPFTKVIQVVGPSADFLASPAAPLVGQAVKFVYSQRQDVGVIEWDLNGDGAFGDAFGPVASRTFAAPGTYAVSLRVSNLDEPPARSTSTQLVPVGIPPVTRVGGPAALRLMSPFPVVRITGKLSRKGARIKRLTIRAPSGSHVVITCRGRGCPFRRTSQTLVLAGAKSPSKTIRVKRLERRLLRGGVSLKVLISRQGEIGKYTRFRIRTGKAPIRTDQCLTPGSTAPKECPSS